MYYLYEVRDSDGNDCTVYDALVEAPDRERASARLWAWIKRAWPDDEGDGGFGTYHPCDCACDHAGRVDHDPDYVLCPRWDDDAAECECCTPAGEVCERCRDGWDCNHGGIVTSEDGGDSGIEVFETEDEARAACAVYHILIDLTGEPDDARDDARA